MALVLKLTALILIVAEFLYDCPVGLRQLLTNGICLVSYPLDGFLKHDGAHLFELLFIIALSLLQFLVVVCLADLTGNHGVGTAICGHFGGLLKRAETR